jgi:hypothetical protein
MHNFTRIFMIFTLVYMVGDFKVKMLIKIFIWGELGIIYILMHTLSICVSS